jgi:two-component sensor histidine kinase/PAS domain-containing protein
VPIVLLWGEDGVMIYNDAYSGFAGGRHPQLLGSKVREGWPEVADFNDNVMKVGLAGGTLAYKNQELTLYRHGRGEPVWMNLDYSPVLDERGQPAGVIAIVVETTETVLAARRVAESEARLRALVDASSDVIYRMAGDWRTLLSLDGRGFLADSMRPSSDWVGTYVFAEDRPRVAAEIDAALRDRRPFQLEHRVCQADGQVGWVASRAVPLFDAAGEITEWFGAASDVTERRRAEDHLRLVVNELNHRVKNNLAMTQAIAAQTFRSGDDVAEAQQRFTARLVALAQANDLLTGERWAAASLSGVVDQAVRPHAANPDRLRIAGPEVQLSPKTALALTLALHELATNALKYGAWSGDAGTVSIAWRTYAPQDDAPQRLCIEWRESGGPPVAPPARRGFGSRLIERGLAAEMGGTVELRFEAEGLACIVDAPLSLYRPGE